MLDRAATPGWAAREGSTPGGVVMTDDHDHWRILMRPKALFSLLAVPAALLALAGCGSSSSSSSSSASTAAETPTTSSASTSTPAPASEGSEGGSSSVKLE